DMWMQWFRANLAMSTPEMYLIAAECEARIGSKDNAIALLNKLRNKRIENNEALTASTADEVLNVVLAERRREFPLLGLTRLIDLKRLNQEARFAKTVTHTVNGVAYTLSPNDSKYVLPIPAKVLRFNPGMPQNER
ncbi:MAG: RagB/SusD family nutrient uptake outer membrane protein, partial [Bacteroidales bacterium]|nr:RagB/SusD family nutrient uptake outer membrane protein [Bacteroidales bacterium]